mmetsp:Transcript_71740/g.171420  ORF Transcript_71740/g.171420 Transcript_71740/m.171420 type:complete len:106 (+) Transcript_71740:447-764(+)
MGPPFGVGWQSMSHSLQRWISEAGDLRIQFWLWLAELDSSSNPPGNVTLKAKVISPRMMYALQLLFRFFHLVLWQCVKHTFYGRGLADCVQCSIGCLELLAKACA